MKQLITYIIVLLLASFTACNDREKADANSSAAQTYTCPMHPQIVAEAPGTCPICGMDLVAVDKRGTDATLMLSQSQRLLANVFTDTVRTGSFSSSRQLNGRIALNPAQNEMISSRVAGRIENLYVKETGVLVKKGQPLYRIYSEQLAALQQEYLVAIAQAAQFPGDEKFEQIAEAARQRLLLFDQTEAQLRNLRTGKKTNPYVTYVAPAGGAVAQLFVGEGQYVAEGGPVMQLEGYQSVWVEADVYPAEAGNVRVGDVVDIKTGGNENSSQKMRIEFIAPALQAGSQLLTVRGQVPNPGNLLRPGMQVFVEVPVSAVSNAVTLPVDAVIRDGSGTHIWIEKAPGIFEARSVVTGAENFNRVEISSGLQAGEVAVVSGAYLLYSEFILKKGTTPAGEHNH